MLEVKNNQQQNIRLLAVKALSDINRNGAYANIKLQEYLQKYHLSDLDRRFFTELVYGVIRRKKLFRCHNCSLCKTTFEETFFYGCGNPLDLGFIKLSTWIRFLKVRRSMNLSNLRKKLTRGLSGFVNAVLRSVCVNAIVFLLVNLLSLKPKRFLSSTINRYGLLLCG